MARSNRQDVEANKIDPDERLDFVIPRNGSRRLYVRLTELDDEGNETPRNLTGATIRAGAKTSYQAASLAIEATVENRDDADGSFELLYTAAGAAGLGIDVLDLVHDAVLAPSGGGQPERIFAGLLELSKGVLPVVSG